MTTATPPAANPFANAPANGEAAKKKNQAPPYERVNRALKQALQLLQDSKELGDEAKDRAIAYTRGLQKLVANRKAVLEAEPAAGSAAGAVIAYGRKAETPVSNSVF